MREKIVLAAVLVRPFRCEQCDYRFYRWSFREKRSRDRTQITS